MSIIEQIKAVQRAEGLDDDGKAGVKTWNAIYKRYYPARPDVFPVEEVDSRSERVIASLEPTVQPYARALVQQAKLHGITIKIISGLRSYAEQDALYAKGRTAAGVKVTNARGGYSNHNFGTAFDVGVFSGNNYLEESPAYKAVGAIGKSLGLDWGGNWTGGFQDDPHFQLRPEWARDMKESEMISELRRRKAIGQAVFS